MHSEQTEIAITTTTTTSTYLMHFYVSMAIVPLATHISESFWCRILGGPFFCMGLRLVMLHPQQPRKSERKRQILWECMLEVLKWIEPVERERSCVISQNMAFLLRLLGYLSLIPSEKTEKTEKTEKSEKN